jgi:serine/threonine protein kinase
MPDALTARPTDLLEGDVFAGCRVEAVAGRGGMGIVYRAVQLSLGRPVALKLIASEHAADPEFRDRFEREARLAAAIDHPNVIPVYAAGEEDGRLYLVVRFVRGTDLHHLIRRGGALPPSRAAALVEQVGLGLDAAHAAGLVHRDVKPANVLLGPDDHAYLIDFGLTKDALSDAGPTGSGEWVGTLDFVAPEQIRAEDVDARADVYGLGCLLHYLLTGAPPFPRRGDEAKLWAHLSEPPPRSGHLAMDAVIARALASGRLSASAPRASSAVPRRPPAGPRARPTPSPPPGRRRPACGAGGCRSPSRWPRSRRPPPPRWCCSAARTSSPTAPRCRG